MIPKIIHYCWVGGNPLPDDAKKCIASWKKFCPDFEIKEWNESNYDFTKSKRMKEAYDNKKWGFVPDYARIDIINTYGGIYMDTDVELIKPIDETVLNNKFFCGMGKVIYKNTKNENITNTVQFGLGFGGEKDNAVLKRILEFYDTISFINDDGSFNTTPAPYYETKILKEFGFDVLNDDTQSINGIKIFASDYFSPMDYMSGTLEITKNTYSIHWFSMTWLPEKERYFKKLEWKLSEKYGYKKAHKIVRRRSLLYRARRKIKKFIGKKK